MAEEKAHYYSTKDMCRIFGVGRETLRHYENIGLLSPYINPENGYRVYSYWDVGTMIDILKYRSVGLPLKDTKKAIFDMDYPEIVESIKKQNVVYHDMIKHYEMLDRKTAQDIKYLSLVDEGFGTLKEIDLLDLVFIKYIFPETEDEEKLFQKIYENFEFFATSWIISDTTSDSPIKGLGFSTEREFAEYLNICNGIEIGTGKAVGTLLDMQGHEPINGCMFEEFNGKVTEKYKNASEETYAILLSRFYDKEKVHHQYVFAYKKLV